MKKLIAVIIILISMSCADSKEFTIDNKQVVVEPYGWFDMSQKNDSINYQVNVPNIVISALLIETIAAPILITGTELYEPVSKK